MEKKMLGKNTGSMTFKETNNPIDSGKFGLPAMETSISGGGKHLPLREARPLHLRFFNQSLRGGEGGARDVVGSVCSRTCC